MAAQSSQASQQKQGSQASQQKQGSQASPKAKAPRAPGAGIAVHIDATLCVERAGQKRILIGTGGEMLKRIGTQARLRIQELTGRKVNLKLWVRVEPAWRQERAKLEELGYRSFASGEAVAFVDLSDLPELDAGEP